MDRICIAVKRLNTAVEREMNNAQLSDGLTTIQSTIMGYILDRHGEQIFANKIEKEFCLAHPTVSSILKNLEAKGLIKTKRLEKDRRYKAISATPKSLEYYKSIQSTLDAIEEKMLAGLAEDERTQLANMYQTMQQNME